MYMHCHRLIPLRHWASLAYTRNHIISYGGCHCLEIASIIDVIIFMPYESIDGMYAFLPFRPHVTASWAIEVKLHKGQSTWDASHYTGVYSHIQRWAVYSENWIGSVLEIAVGGYIQLMNNDNLFLGTIQKSRLFYFHQQNLGTPSFLAESVCPLPLPWGLAKSGNLCST